MKISSFLRRLIWVPFIFLFRISLVYGSQDINPHDFVNESLFDMQGAIQQLDSFGCLPLLMRGDLIYSQDELVKLIQHADSACAQSTKVPSYLTDLIHDLKEQFYLTSEESKKSWKSVYVLNPILSLEYLAYANDRRKIPENGIDAISSPWTAYHEGFPFSPGHNAVMRIKSGFSLGNWLDLSIEPSLLAVSSGKPDASFHTGHLKLTWKKTEFKIGRSQILWGYNYGNGAILFSGNSLPFELMQLRSLDSFRLPWIFRHLGFFQYRIFLANLDDQQFFPNPWLLGGRILWKPHSSLEVGLTRALIFGGKGAPAFHFYEPIGELFGFRPWDGWIFNIPFKKGAHSTSGIANNVLGFDILWKIKALNHSELFFEIYNEDPFDLHDIIPEDSIFHLGLWVPRLTPSGEWQFLSEVMYSAKIVYTHGIFASGFTHKGRTIGFDSGPRMFEFHTKLQKLFPPRVRAWGSLSVQLKNTNTTSSASRDEYGGLLRFGLSYLATPHVHLDGAAGLQFIENFNYVAGDRLSPMFNLKFTYQF